MNEYEITYIVSPQLEDKAREELDAGVEKQVSEAKGTIVNNTEGVKQRLAYPITDKNTGYVRVLNIQLDPEKLETLQSQLKKTEGVMRFTVLSTAPREGVTPEMMEKYGRKRKDSGKKPEKREAKPTKKVTMEDVEKGIEEALSEEVK